MYLLDEHGHYFVLFTKRKGPFSLGFSTITDITEDNWGMFHVYSNVQNI